MNSVTLNSARGQYSAFGSQRLKMSQPLAGIHFGAIEDEDSTDDQPVKRRSGASRLFEKAAAPGSFKKFARYLVYTLGIGGGAWLGAESFEKVHPGERGIRAHLYTSGSEEKVRGEGAVFTFPPNLVKLYRYPIVDQQVNEVFKPLSRDGVAIDGDGSPLNGVHVRLDYKVMDNQESIQRLHHRILGHEMPPEEFMKSDSASFKVDDPVTKALYYKEIYMRLENAVWALATHSAAENFHNSRDYISKGLNEGYTETYTDPKTSKVLVEIKVPSLAEQLAPLGIKVEFCQVGKVDIPVLLKALIDRRTQIPLERLNAANAVGRNKAQVATARMNVGINNASLLESARGEAQKAEADAQGMLNTAKQEKPKEVIVATAKRDAAITKENGLAAQRVAEAKAKADAQITAAKVSAQGLLIQADADADAIVSLAKANQTSQRALGKMLKEHPSLMTQLQITTQGDIRKALAARMGLVLVDPTTRVDETILRIGGELYRIPGEQAAPANRPDPAPTPKK